ncbi:MAG: lipoyl(octanoyl) transferase LipB [Anaerolineaceae bacterium]
MRKEICQAAWLGKLPYETAWRMQEELAEEIALGKRPPSFLLLEHPHTFTAGRSTKPGHLLWDEPERVKNGVELYEVDRGGDITYHGPGQLVGYPLFRLPPLLSEGNSKNSTDAVGFIRKIESALILALAQFGIEGFQKPGFSGVWVEQKPFDLKIPTTSAKKIASIGVKVDVNRVTRHGFTLNVNPDMRYWSGIIACGLEGVSMTSMANCLGWVPEIDKVIEAVIHSFGTIFGYEIIFKHPK